MMTKNLLVLALTLSFASAFAQSQDQVMNQAPIDVDGYLQEQNVTDGELEQIKGEIRKQKGEVILNKEKTKGFKELSKTTEKLSDTTEEYLDEKKTAQKDIAEYNKKIKCLMEENPGKDCSKYVRNRTSEVQQEQVVQEVPVQQAAPVVVAEVAAAPAEEGFLETMKLLPYAGGTQYNGDIEQLEAELSAGLRLESNITSRFAMGIGFNYAQLKTEDFANNLYSSQIFGFGYEGREINYSSMGLDIYGKFFITKGERFRPYIGAGLGYNRANMKYTENDPYSTQMNGNTFNFGNEEFRTSYATGTIMAGSEIMITRGFGLNIEGTFSTGLGNSLSSQGNQNQTNSPDQRRLRELGEEIINANAMSIFVGGVIIF